VSTGEFRVEGGIPCRQGNSVSTGEFRVDGGIPCRRGNSVSTGEFRVDGGIPCRRGNSVSTGEFRVDGGIPCRWNFMSTEFRINVFIINIYVFSFQKCVIGLADFRDL
jgi:formylmethanofuran dehydrogenase subunit C